MQFKMPQDRAVPAEFTAHVGVQRQNYRIARNHNTGMANPIWPFSAGMVKHLDSLVFWNVIMPPAFILNQYYFNRYYSGTQNRSDCMPGMLLVPTGDDDGNHARLFLSVGLVPGSLHAFY